jgi:hypothetical protein
MTEDAPDDLSELAAYFIARAGSKAKAIRAIEAAKGGGSPGAPTKYFVTDAQVLFDVEMMEYEYRRAGVKAPKRRALIKKAVSRKLADGRQLGQSENAAITRINRHSSLSEMFSKAHKSNRSGDRGYLREFWTDVAQDMPPDYSELILKLEPSSDIGALALLWLGSSFRRRKPRSSILSELGYGKPTEGPESLPKKQNDPPLFVEIDLSSKALHRWSTSTAALASKRRSGVR